MPESWFREIYVVLAGVAGSITALSIRPFKRMNKIEIALSLFAGMAFAVFVGPYVATKMYGEEYLTQFRVVGALYYILATGSNILIPVAVRSATRFFGKDAEEREVI